MKPLENLIFRLSGINPEEEMNWKQFLRALLIVNAFWFVWGMILLVMQGYLPLNPDGNIGQTVHLFHTTVCHHVVPVYYSSYRYGCYGWYHESSWRKNNSNYW